MGKDTLTFDNRNPITQKYLIGECQAIARAVESEQEPHVPKHLYETLIAFDIMYRPEEEERRTIYEEACKMHKDKEEAARIAKRYFVVLFCHNNFSLNPYFNGIAASFLKNTIMVF